MDGIDKLLNEITGDEIQSFDIDMSNLNNESEKGASLVISDMANLYIKNAELKNNPILKNKILSETESLKILYKMRVSAEMAHDAAIIAISKNSTNASLYRSLTQTQASILAIQKQIEDTIKNIENILKAYQLEIDFNNDENDEKEVGLKSRGSKDYIKQLREKIDGSTEELNLFEEE